MTTVVLGAGFSRIAGLPLTSELFDNLPDCATDSAQPIHEDVQKSWRAWRAENEDKGPEQFLFSIYEALHGALTPFRVTWPQVLHFVLGRVVKLKHSPKAAYYHGLTTTLDCPEHIKFWELVRSRFLFHAVVTTNYDILAEQGLLSQARSPLFYYGGFHFPQFVEKTVNLAPKKKQLVPLGDEIAVCKLHGSINWAYEPCGARGLKKNDRAVVLKILHDVRTTLRLEGGDAAIIPPLPEKQMEPKFSSIWTDAERALGASSLWIVCGQAINPYDTAVRELFGRAARTAISSGTLSICVIDPNPNIASRWREITSPRTQIHYLPSIGEALAESAWDALGL